MIEPVVGFSTKCKRLSFEVPYRQFKCALDREVPVLEAGQPNSAAPDRVRGSAGGCRGVTCLGEYALCRISYDRPVVERGAVTKRVLARENGTVEPSLGGGRPGDRPISRNGLENARAHVRCVVLIGQIPDISGYKPMPEVENRRASIATLAQRVLRKVVAVNRVAALWAENVRPIVE